MRCWGCCSALPRLPKVSLDARHSRLSAGVPVVGSCRTLAMCLGIRHKEGAAAGDSMDRNPVGEKGPNPVAGRGRRGVDYCNLGTRIVDVRVDLAAGAARWERY